MSSDNTGYKAMVCVFLEGGNQSYNMIVPYTTAHYNEYAASRSALAISRSSLLPLTTLDANGNQYGMHPNCTEMAAMMNAGAAAIISNVGTLVAPTTKASYAANAVALPSQLFSHVDQQAQWMTSIAGNPTRIGWGGRVNDVYLSEGVAQNLAAGIAIGGQEAWTQGNQCNTYTIGTQGAQDFSFKGFTSGSTTAFNALHSLGASDPNLLINQVTAVQVSTSSKLTLLTSCITAAGSFSTVFNTSDPLQQQLIMAAKIIKAHATSGDTREAFFIAMPGYDTHNAELVTQATLLSQLSVGLNVFAQAMAEIGMSNAVTTFTNSEFSRTLQNNGDGSDHAWGGYAFAMGGQVIPGWYGTNPSVVLGSSDDVDGLGRIIPTTSTDQYAACLAKWYGIRGYRLTTLFPNLANFPVRALRFLPQATPTFTENVTTAAATHAFDVSPVYTAPNGVKAAVQVNCLNASASGFATQNSWSNSEADFGVVSNHTNDSVIKSYTSSVRGWKFNSGFLTPTDTNLGTGLLYSTITKFQARFAFEAPDVTGPSGPTATNRVNSVWDIFMHQVANPTSTANPHVNLQICQYTLDADGVYAALAAGGTTVTIGGKSWIYLIGHTTYSGTFGTGIQMWPAPASGSVFGFKDITVNLKAIIDYFVGLGTIVSTDYLTGIEFGWQIIAGGTYIATDCWSALQSEAVGVSGLYVSA